MGRIVESMVAINSLAGFKTTYVNSFAEMTEEGRRIFRDIEGKHRVNVKPEIGMDTKEAFKELLGDGLSSFWDQVMFKTMWTIIETCKIRISLITSTRVFARDLFASTRF